MFKTRGLIFKSESAGEATAAEVHHHTGPDNLWCAWFMRSSGRVNHQIKSSFGLSTSRFPNLLNFLSRYDDKDSHELFEGIPDDSHPLLASQGYGFRPQN
jgi:hypothetical protein